MGRGRDKLTAAMVAKHTKPGYLLDGGGLYLQIALRTSREKGISASAGVTKSWTFRYRDRVTGKLRELGLGPLADVSLSKARKKAAELRGLLQDGKDPMAEKAAGKAAQRAEVAKAKTFDQVAKDCIAKKRAGWKNDKHADQWTSTLATYASPVIGSLPIASIDQALVLKVLDPIWTIKNETASRVRQRIETVLAFATVSGYRTGDNPARWRGHLDHLLSKPSKVQNREHHAALPYGEVADFLVSLRNHHGAAALALEFTILTAARTGEVIHSRWEEIDLKQGVWTIPKERMKAEKEHIVPLVPRAAAILRELGQVKRSPYVFTGQKDGAPISNMAMAALLKRMGRTDITVHGFRSTFRDWAGEQTSFARELIEHALAHRLKDKAEAAYARSTMVERRRELMVAWEQACLAKVAKRQRKHK